MLAAEGQTFRQMPDNLHLYGLMAVYFFDRRRHCGSRVLAAEARRDKGDICFWIPRDWSAWLALPMII
ncbi:hypothetical protein SB861_46850 [Paraburkholderia sp. SIMBA_049]